MQSNPIPFHYERISEIRSETLKSPEKNKSEEAEKFTKETQQRKEGQDEIMCNEYCVLPIPREIYFSERLGRRLTQ